MAFRPDRIKELIDKQGFSIKAFAKVINCSDAGLGKTINGKSAPSVEIIERIADFFNLSIDYFFEREIALIQTKVSESDLLSLLVKELGQAKEEIAMLKIELEKSKITLNESEQLSLYKVAETPKKYKKK